MPVCFGLKIAESYRLYWVVSVFALVLLKSSWVYLCFLPKLSEGFQSSSTSTFLFCFPSFFAELGYSDQSKICNDGLHWFSLTRVFELFNAMVVHVFYFANCIEKPLGICMVFSVWLFTILFCGLYTSICLMLYQILRQTYFGVDVGAKQGISAFWTRSEKAHSWTIELRIRRARFVWLF